MHGRGRIAPRRTKDAGQETTTAIARRAAGTGGLGLGTGLLQFGFQLLVLLVEALDRCLLHQDRLGHVIRRRRLLTHMFLDTCLGLRITWLARVFGLLEAAEQAVDQGLFFSIHGATSWGSGQRTASKMGRTGAGFNHWRRETFFSK
ncbi:hypothetical protein D3C71_1718110 [compost metagenome]